MPEKSLTKNAILNALSSFLSVLFPLVTFPYITRVLMPEGIGMVNFAEQTVGLFGIIASLGFGIYAMREAAKIRDDREKLSEFCSEILALHLVTTVVSYACLFTTIFNVQKYESYRLLILMTSPLILSNTILMEWLYTALEEFEYMTVRQIILRLISLALLFALVRDSGDVIQYALISVIYSLCSGLFNFFHARKYIKFIFVRPKNLLRHIRPVVILSGISIASGLYNIIDTNLLGFFSTDFQIGIYAAAHKITRIIISILVAVYSVIVPRLSYYTAEGVITDEYSKMLGKSINLIEIICIPSMVGIIILSKPILTLLFGADYEPSIIVMQVLSATVFFVLSGGVLGDTVFTPLRKDKLNLYPVIAGMIANVFFSIVFIPKYGAVGAAMGTAIAECAVCVTKVLLARKYIKGQKIYSEIWKYFFSAAVMGACIYFITKNIRQNAVQILSGLATGVASYYLILKLLRCSFLDYIDEMAKKYIPFRNRKKETKRNA